MAKPYKSVLTRHQLQQLAGLFRRRLEEWLEQQLDPYFASLEESFFSHAEQAASDALRQGYTYAVRELGRKRGELGLAFRNNLLKAVETFFLHYEAYLEEFIHGFTASTATPESLELVNNEKLEEDLVVLRTSHRATSNLQPGHKEMVSYMAAVVQPKDLPQNGTPLSPQVIANCMRMALSGWEGTAASRFLFYQVLADRMLPELVELYPSLIRALQKMGLDPVQVQVKVKRPHPRQRALPLSGYTRTATGRQGNSRVEGEEAALFSVLSLMRQLGDEDREFLGMVGSVAGAARSSGAAMKPESLAQVVRELQENHFREVAGLEETRAIQESWKRDLVQGLKRRMEEEQLRLHNLDQQIIDIVTMLFDFVLDDSLIPDSMKVLLIRLQMPVLQIAIRDKTFLTDSRHPARVLVNNLSRAAVRWVDVGDYSDDSVYGMIRNSVERILQGDGRDPGLYLEVNRDFEEFLAQEERGARVAEERISQVARGKEQLAMARRRVADILDGLVTEELPDVVRQILEDAWRDVLTLILLREGEESDAWREALGVARRLAHSVWGEEIEQQRDRFVAEVPQLLGELRRGFASIAYDSKKSAQLLEKLEACHAAASRGGASVAVSCARATTAGKEKAGDEAAGSAEPDRYDQLVQSLREGDWVRWELAGEGERRGKLAWRSEIADILLFVDMRGRKLAEHSSRELAGLFRNGQASLLAHIDQPFMERALRYLHRLLSRRVSRNLPRIMPA